MDEEENFPYYVDDKDSKEIIEINEQDAINGREKFNNKHLIE